MADLTLLYSTIGIEKTIWLINRAMELAEKNPKITCFELQNSLSLGTSEAFVLIDWLADNNRAEARISNHWIKCGRMYVMNNKNTSLVEMENRLKIGHQSAFRIMLELQKKKIINIKSDFSFDKIKNGTTTEGFISQIRRFGKKYRNRCEPELLTRTMYLDYETAYNWAQFGKNELGLVWRGRWKKLKKVKTE